MPITIGPGITVGAGITVGNTPPLVTQGLTLRLDANDATSYPGSGTTWFDISGNNANISLVNSPAYTAASPAYFTFVPASSQTGSGSTSNVVPQTSYTKSVWFYLNAVADNNLVSSEAGGHFMYFGPGTTTLYCGHTNWPVYTVFPSVTTFSLNTWYYAALTFNTSDGMVLYVNGVQDATYTANKTAHGGTGAVNLARFGAGNFLDGRLAEVYCYDRSLSAAEVLENFNGTKSRYGF